MADQEQEVDILSLRQRLRDEYAFVNKQKHDLQKEHTNIVSTGDSLLRGLWIAGQQWRNFNRLKGGPKFASECTYTSNLLDSITFKDGYATVGFKEVKYGNFLRDLRENSDLLKSILIFADHMNLDTSAFLRTIITSIYGSCLFPRDEKSLLIIIRDIIQYHLVYSEKPLNIYNNNQNSFINILNVILHTSLPCTAFLGLACREVVFDILLDSTLYWTVEEQELLSVMDVTEVRKRFGEPGSAGTTERIRDHMMRCWLALADTLYDLFKKIKNSLICMPDILIWIISCFYNSSLERGFNDGKARQMVMRFFFNQVIVPLLESPQPFIIDTEIRAPRVAMFNLKKVTLIIQTLVSIEAGDDISFLSLEARQFYQNLDKGPLHEIVNILVEQLPKDSDALLSDRDSMPGIARTSVLITKTNLDSLVSLFCQLKHFHSPSNAGKNQFPAKQLINHTSLEKLLSHLEGIHSVTSNLAKMSFSTETTDIRNNLHKALQAFNKPINEDDIVLIISLGVTIIECPGMLSEEKVLGIPTPKPRRKSTMQEEISNPMDDISENSSNSDSNDSSDEKPPEHGKSDDVDSAEDCVKEDMGFDDSFVEFSSTNPFAENVDETNPNKLIETIPSAHNVDPFAGFDSEFPVLSKDDPFTSVVTRLPEQPAHIYQPPASLINHLEQAPSKIPTNIGTLSTSSSNPSSQSQNSLSPNSSSPFPNSSSLSSEALSPQNNQAPLIDLGDSESWSTDAVTSSMATEVLQFSSGSQSSNESGKRFSSSASSSSDSGVKLPSLKKEPNIMNSKKEKKGGEVHRKKSLRDIQHAITSRVTSPKNERSKFKGSTLVRKIGGRKKKATSERLLNEPTDVATSIIHADTTKTAKETTQVSRDEEEIMEDAKNKLRLILSNGSAPVFPVSASHRMSVNKEDALMTYLKQDLADAIACQDCTMIARISETLSTFEKLPTTRYPEVLKKLQQDYLSRKAYLSYLVRAHQGLVGTRQFFQKALERVDREREICRRYLMMQCVSMFMQGRKDKLDVFVRKFERLSLTDEKSEEMKVFIQMIKQEFQQDPLWFGSNDEQRVEAFDAIERYSISRVYWAAIYAYGETDKCRDDVFHQTVNSMCKTIGKDFALLEIKEEFQNEAPWLPAQNELRPLSAYKTPKDKLKCIQRCCTTIMSLLGMSSGDAVGADAFTPVLIYVVMHANPRGLLTTVDFINNYLYETLTGEQYYCWMQFCSAIQFIKILLEENNSRKL
ncbi:GTPase-activating protein and VPS9 domain-containing protein 1-like isoform X2 [Dendronephthya gigantea]|uniref:GTPase-activating protein and VPS9 domain-containing protein 1-like isoform X2 n=1 Tax=Dendronephthya gigantea TaxID=151771 RepID=UPI00106DC395|nr:GTPase-activating protein and VPS9 domain-containing protein 1-like isoform X2 [Dendronephthya gigantea]